MGMYHAIVLLIIVMAIAIYDVVVISVKGKHHSISAWAIKTAYKYPSVIFIVAFGLGYVFGHLTWRMRTLDIYDCTDQEVIEIINTCKVTK